MTLLLTHHRERAKVGRHSILHGHHHLHLVEITTEVHVGERSVHATAKAKAIGERWILLAVVFIILITIWFSRGCLDVSLVLVRFVMLFRLVVFRIFSLP